MNQQQCSFNSYNCYWPFSSFKAFSSLHALTSPEIWLLSAEILGFFLHEQLISVTTLPNFSLTKISIPHHLVRLFANINMKQSAGATVLNLDPSACYTQTIKYWRNV